MRNLTNAQLAELLDKDIFHKISQAADSLGMECYVVGGYVRDLFLERPSNDIDVVVVGSGIQVATALKVFLARRLIFLYLRISVQHKLNIKTQRWNLWVHERKATLTTRASLSSKTELWKMTKTVATSPSTLLPYA